MKHLICLLLAMGLMLSSYLPVAGQNTLIDSLKSAANDLTATAVERLQAYTSLGWQYRRVNLDSGLLHLQQAAPLLPTTNYDSLYFEYDYVLGTLYRYQGGFPAAIEAFLRCLEFGNDRNDLDRQGRANYAISIAYTEDQQYEEAILHAQRAREVFKEQGLIARELGTLNVLATILKDTRRVPEAEAAYLEAYAIAEEQDIIYQLEPICNNLAALYLDETRYAEAIHYFEKALGINEAQRDLHGIATVQGNLADTYLWKGDYAKAANYFEQAIAGKEQQGATEDLIGLRGMYGCALIYLGRQEEGLAIVKEYLQLARENGYKEEAARLLQMLCRSTSGVGMYEEATECHLELIAAHQREFSENLASKVDELNAKYRKAEQDQKITLLSTENELQETRLSRQRLMLWGSGTILLIVSFLFFAIYRLYRKVTDQNEVIETALAEKDILLKEIHHRVKNNLQVVSSLLNLQSYKITDETALRAITEGRTRVQSMSLIHQTLYRKDNLTGVNIKEYLAKLCESLFETYNITHNQIELHTDIEALMLDVDSVVPLGLIINELITNSLKYAFPDDRQGHIDITVQETAAGLLLRVADDGIGIPDVEKVRQGDSFGYDLINAFKHKLEADLDIDNQVGTKVSLLIRNYHKAA